MSIHKRLGLLAVATSLACSLQIAGAQTQSSDNFVLPEDVRNQFEFVIGDWDIEVTLANGNVYAAEWQNRWLADGVALVQEWRGPYTKGIEVRYYNAVDGGWQGYNVYTMNGGQARRTTSRADGDNMIVIIEAINRQGQEFLNRETYSDISESGFSMRSERSYDDGESWQTGQYSMIATRQD